ncbi:MAG: hypothetical protein U0353_23010 [Sandaracinus sp.]
MPAERVSFGRVLLDVSASAGWLVALAVLLAVPSCCLVTLPAFGFVAGTALLRVSGARRASMSTWRLGVLGAPLYFAPIAALLLASFVFEAFPGRAERSSALTLEVTVGISSLLGIVLFPLHAAPLEAIESGSGMIEAMLGAGARTSRAGLVVTVIRGALVGLVTALPWLVPGLVEQLVPGHDPWRLVLLYASVVAAQLVGLSIVAHAWSEGRERFGAARTLVTAPRRPVPARARLVGSLVLAASPALLLTLGVLLALSTPTAAWRREPRLEASGRGYALPFPTGVPCVEDPLRDTTEGLTVTTPRAGVWLIATRDGGGAGEVRIPGGDAQRATLSRERFRERDVWTLRVPTSSSVALVSFEDRGVRVDDTPLDRIRARAGSAGLWLALVYTLALAMLLALQLRRAGVAAGLDRPRFSGVPERAALTGTLRTEAAIPVSSQGLVLAESARLELGELGTITLSPGTHPLLVPSPVSVARDGATLTAIAMLPATEGSPFRDGRASLPERAQLVLGSLEEARELYAERVARTNVLASLPLLVVGLGLTTWVVTHL